MVEYYPPKELQTEEEKNKEEEKKVIEKEKVDHEKNKQIEQDKTLKEYYEMSIIERINFDIDRITKTLEQYDQENEDYEQRKAARIEIIKVIMLNTGINHKSLFFDLTTELRNGEFYDIEEGVDDDIEEGVDDD